MLLLIDGMLKDARDVFGDTRPYSRFWTVNKLLDEVVLRVDEVVDEIKEEVVENDSSNLDEVSLAITNVILDSLKDVDPERRLKIAERIVHNLQKFLDEHKKEE